LEFAFFFFFPSPQDAHAAEALNEDHCLVAVFDGHGGQYAAIFSAENIAAKLKSMEDWHRYMQDQTVRVCSIWTFVSRWGD
jgi:serine/threonine protein phosphatase PrpC